MAGIFEVIYIVAVVVLMFGAAIFVHEFGHYWVALKRGLKVEEFAIGFGPIMFKWEREGILYTVRWIPAGGFVKLPQMITSEALEGKAEDEEQLPPVTPLSKILVAVAGPFMNVVFAFVIGPLIWVVGKPVQVSPPVVGYVDPNSELRETSERAGLLPGDRFLTVDGNVIDTWKDVQNAAVFAQSSVVKASVKRGDQALERRLKTKINDDLGLKLLDLAPRSATLIDKVEKGSAFEKAGLKPGDEVAALDDKPVYSPLHFIALMLEEPGREVTLKVLRRESDKGPKTATDIQLTTIDPPGIVAAQVVEDSPAASAGIRKGDRILQFNGTPVRNPEHLVELVGARPNKKTEVQLQRKGKSLTVQVTPRRNPETKQVLIGIMPIPNLPLTFAQPPTVYRITNPNPVEQVSEVLTLMGRTISGLANSSKTKVSARALSGPAGIFSYLAKFVRDDLRLALSFLVLLNINLAILNLLPIPVLDGGHIVMAIIEQIRGRPISARLVEYTTTAFAVLLISFMVYVTFFDIKRVTRYFGAMFDDKIEYQDKGATDHNGNPEPAQPAAP